MRAPLRVTIGAPKGGCARSTTAVYLALAAARRRPHRRVHLLDVDPATTTAWSWATAATEHGTWPDPVMVTACDAGALPALVDQLTGQDPHAHLIIDTSSRPALLAGAALTPTVLLTCSPTHTDLAAVPATLQALAPTALAATDLPVLTVLLTRTHPRSTASLTHARTRLRALGLHVEAEQIPHREAIAQAYATAPADLGEYPDVLAGLLTRKTRPPARFWTAMLTTQAPAQTPVLTDAAQDLLARSRRVPRRQTNHALPADAVALVDKAVRVAAATHHERLTRQDAVAYALRATYGHLITDAHPGHLFTPEERRALTQDKASVRTKSNFALPLDTLDLIRAAQRAAFDQHRWRLTRQDALTHALRRTYGHLMDLPATAPTPATATAAGAGQ